MNTGEHGFLEALVKAIENPECRVEEENGFLHAPPRHVHGDLQLPLTFFPLAYLAKDPPKPQGLRSGWCSPDGTGNLLRKRAGGEVR
jgi:hypothetical protein